VPYNSYYIDFVEIMAICDNLFFVGIDEFLLVQAFSWMTITGANL